MIITESQMYWLTRLDGIKNIFLAATIMLVILSGFFLVCYFIEIDEPKGKRSDNLAAKLFIGFVILVIFSFLTGSIRSFIPTTKEMAAIKLVPLIASNQNIQEIPSKLAGLADEWIDELKPKKEQK